MAIINSVGVGRGEKSVGEFTYRRARGGRTIAARRIIENKSNTPAQAAQRSEFGRIGNVLSGIPKRIMEMLSVKTKYGSARNNFFERNYGGLSVLSEGDSGLSSDFSLAARLNNFATSSMQSSDIYIMPVVGDLQPNFESISEAGTASASISASVRMREGIKKVELGIIAVNAASRVFPCRSPSTCSSWRNRMEHTKPTTSPVSLFLITRRRGGFLRHTAQHIRKRCAVNHCS